MQHSCYTLFIINREEIKMTFMVFGLLFIAASSLASGLFIHWLEEGGY